jgi:hypothetical protein
MTNYGLVGWLADGVPCPPAPVIFPVTLAGGRPAGSVIIDASAFCWI